ncbi:MAG: hypothetical protein ABJA82_01015 [Myxococcales bacterium]
MDIALPEKVKFYRAGVLGMRALQDLGQGTRRFSADADARWKAFRGDLGDSDRLDLLIRDAAAVHPVAFSPALVFGLGDLAADEPFGPGWGPLAPSEAGPVLREAATTAAAPATSRSSALGKITEMLGLVPKPIDVSAVGPASRIVAAGAGAILALAEHMAGRADTDFGDQILLVTDLAAERQLFGIASALCASRARPRTAASDESVESIKARGFDRSTVTAISVDADEAARRAALRITQELGA